MGICFPLRQIMSSNKVIEENLRLHEEEAENYRSWNAEIYNSQEQKRISSIIDEAIQLLETEDSSRRALDVGCGTGNILGKMSSRFDKAVGVDLSEDMLSVAYTDHLQKRENLKLVRGRIADLPFPDNYFDVVSAYSVFHHLPEFSGPIYEMSRVLKEGGVIYIDHEPVKRDDFLVKLYTKFRDMLNGNFADGLPPYEETGGIDREYCDYQIHHGENGGIPTDSILKLCKTHGLEPLVNERYLSQGTTRRNPLHPFFELIIDNEWLLIARKKN